MNSDDDRLARHDTRDCSVMFLLSALNVGGSERKTVRLANALATSNRRVAIAYLNGPETLRSQLDPGVATINLGRRGKFSIAALRRLAAFIDERGVDTVFAVNLYPALYAVLAKAMCERRPLRVVASVNTTEFGTRKEQLQMLLYRHVLRRVDGVVFGAECQRRLWLARYGLARAPGRSFVLYNGVDTAEFSRPSVVPAALDHHGSSGVMLGTVGALRAEKAQVDLVRAVHELSSRGVDAGAIIVGDGPQRPDIEQEIRRLGVERQVHLVGEVRDVRPYLAVMDVFVLPSTAVETFSNAVLEAMAMSCPVVVARVGGMEEMLQYGGGRIYPAADVGSLCDLLIPLIANRAARRELGEQARQVVEQHFSFGQMFSDFGRYVLEPGSTGATARDA